MRARLIVVGIDDILRLFQDYTALTGSIPEDAACETLLFNKGMMKMCLRISSDTWTTPQAPESIAFTLRRLTGVN